MSAVNSQIALAVQPPPAAVGPLDQAHNAMSLQALINQTQLQKQQEQSNAVTQQQQQIELANQQQDQKDQTTLRDAFRNNNGDFDATMKEAQTSGVSPQKILALQGQRLKQQTDLASLNKDLLGNEAAKHKSVAEDAQTVLSLPADQRQAKWTELSNKHVLAGTFKPGEIAQTVPDENGLTDLRNGSKEVLDNLTAAQALKEKQEKDPQVQADAAADRFRSGAGILASSSSDPEYQSRKNFLKAQGYKPEELALYPDAFTTGETPAKLQEMALSPEEKAKLQGTGTADTNRYIAIQAAKAQKQPISSQDAAWAKGYEKNKELNTITKFNLGAQNPLIPGGGGTSGGSGGAAGGAGTGAPGSAANSGPSVDSVPPQIRGTVKQILDNRAAMPPQGRANPTNQAIRYWVNQLDPQYDETAFPAKSAVVKKYVADAGDGQIGAINTALGHLGELEEARKAAASSDFPLLQNIASRVGAAVGSDAPTTYKMILHRVGPEMTAAYVKGGGGEAERGAAEKDFDLSNGDKQVASNIAESAKLLDSKLSSKRSNWNNEFKPHRPEDDFDQRFVTPEARQTLTTLSANAPSSKRAAAAGGGAAPLASGMTRVKASDGFFHDVPTAKLDAARAIDPGLQVQK